MVTLFFSIADFIKQNKQICLQNNLHIKTWTDNSQFIETGKMNLLSF